MFRDDLRASVKEFRVYREPRRSRWSLTPYLGEPGERPPYSLMACAMAALGIYLLAPVPVRMPTAEILRDGPSPVAAWTQPSTADLLSGQACIPLSRLLENRPMGVEHSYARPVVCPS